MLVYFVMAVTSVREKSTTFDELCHLTAGYSYWITGDFRLNAESGTLAQQWQALPLLFGGYRFPSLEQEAWWKADVFAVGYHFFYDQGNDVGAMLRAGRTMTAVLGVGLGLLVYAWSRRLFGPTGGVLSAALYAFCPTLLANGRLITTDLAAALFFTASVWSLWVAFHVVSPRSVLVAALAVAGLWQAQVAAVLILPTAVAQPPGVPERRAQLRRLAVVLPVQSRGEDAPAPPRAGGGRGGRCGHAARDPLRHGAAVGAAGRLLGRRNREQLQPRPPPPAADVPRHARPGRRARVLARDAPTCRQPADRGGGARVRRRVGQHLAALPRLLQPARRRPAAGLPASGRQLARLGPGPSRARALARAERPERHARVPLVLRHRQPGLLPHPGQATPGVLRHLAAARVV